MSRGQQVQARAKVLIERTGWALLVAAAVLTPAVSFGLGASVGIVGVLLVFIGLTLRETL